MLQLTYSTKCEHPKSDVGQSRAEWFDRNATLYILTFGNFRMGVLRTYIAAMVCSTAHRSQGSGSHKRTKICLTPFTLLLDHFLQILTDSK